MNLTHMGLFFTQEIAELSELDVPTSSKEVKEQLQLLDTIADKLITFAVDTVKVLVIAFLIYFIGKKVIKWTLKVLTKFFDKSSMDEGVSKFILSLIKAVLYGILFICVVGKLGIPTSSFIALIGSAGVTVGLALQGSLSNFAGGILILILKPFRVGDYIIAGGLEGKVTAIDIFYTKLLSVDNQYIVIPNGTLSNTNIVNVTNEDVRRLDLLVEVDYSENMKHVKEVLYRLASGHELSLSEEYDIDVFVNSFEASAIQMGVRVWVAKDNYWKLKWELLEQIKETFDEENISIPYNQLDVKLKN